MIDGVLTELEFKQLFCKYASLFTWRYIEQLNNTREDPHYAIITNDELELCPIEVVARKHLDCISRNWFLDAKNLGLTDELRDMIIKAADNINSENNLSWFFRYTCGFEPIAHMA